MLNKIRPQPWDWPGPDRPASCRPQRRPGPSISVPTWALCYPKQCQSSDLDLRFSASIARTLAPFHFISHRLCSLERERENAGGHKGVAEGWVVAVALPTRLLVGVRCSPEGERTAVSRRCPLVATGADTPATQQVAADARWPRALPGACHLQRWQIWPWRWGRSLLPLGLGFQSDFFFDLNQIPSF
jgi:hypothetical protein